MQSLATILNRGLDIAAGLGLPVTTWRVGDPTRTLYYYQAEVLAAREEMTAEFIRSATLSTAQGDWLKVVARELYGVEPVEASYVVTTVTLTNAGGGYYNLDPGDFTVSSSTSGKTFRNTSSGAFAGPGVIVFDVIADEAGSDSNVLVNEIDTLVTVLNGVTVTASAAAVATDAQSDESIREQCRATLGALSPNGAADAYEYVARNSALTGTTEVTRAKAVEAAGLGQVTVVLAGATGDVSPAAVAFVQDAIIKWATPLTVTSWAESALEQPVNVTITYSGDDFPAGFDDAAEALLLSLINSVPIQGMVARSALIAAVDNYARAQGASNVSVLCSAPAADVTVLEDYVATGGTISVSEAP